MHLLVLLWFQLCNRQQRHRQLGQQKLLLLCLLYHQRGFLPAILLVSPADNPQNNHQVSEPFVRHLVFQIWFQVNQADSPANSPRSNPHRNPLSNQRLQLVCRQVSLVLNQAEILLPTLRPSHRQYPLSLQVSPVANRQGNLRCNPLLNPPVSPTLSPLVNLQDSRPLNPHVNLPPNPRANPLDSLLRSPPGSQQ